ncbi:MAG: V-type ATP synthase subunit D [Deltaproteobacteria bacterium]|nr:V-type ATP synthase subunit D [Deltaproteobacteria bacterium]
MTTGRRPAATRSNLVRLRRRLTQVEKGADLLRRKRESLVAELFLRARPVVDSRRMIDQQALAAYRALLGALASRGRADLLATGWPTREVRVDLEPLELWGMRAFDLASPPSLVRSVAARATVPSHGEAAPQVAAEEFERLVEQLLAAAPKELLMRRLGQALSRTTRLVNTLEQRVAVSLGADLAHLRRTLDEREREEHLRLKRIASRRARR